MERTKVSLADVDHHSLNADDIIGVWRRRTPAHAICQNLNDGSGVLPANTPAHESVGTAGDGAGAYPAGLACQVADIDYH